MPEEEVKPEVKKVKGVITTLKVTRYKGCPVYICKIYETVFEYLIIFNNQIYRDYMIFTPEEGRTTLTEKQTNSAAGMCLIGATVTIDELIKQMQELLLSNPVKNVKVIKSQSQIKSIN